jgi:PAS domain S-box-containing protein
MVRSIAERRKYESRLYESEMRFESVFSSAGVGVAILGLDGRIQVINPAMLRILGFPELTPVGRPFIGYIKADEQESWKEQFETITSGSVNNRYLQSCLIGREGEESVARIALSLVRTVQGKAEYLILVAENITDEKRMERELIDVEGRLTDAAESERIHLAQDLHDGPLQDLYGIMYQIKMISMGSVDAKTYAELDHTQEMVQATIDKLRATTGGLRPPTLAHFGLERGIRAQIDTLGDTIQGLNIHLDLQSEDDQLPERTRNTLFRIYEQGMSNLLRHAHAKNVEIRLKIDEEKVMLSIEDDGEGFVVPDRWVELVAAGHYGLVGAAERAVSIGGSLQIRSRPGQGTLFQVTVPRKETEQVQTERLSVLVANPSVQGETGEDLGPGRREGKKMKRPRGEKTGR